MWDVIKLGDVATYVNGYAFKPSDWGKVGLPIIRIQNITKKNTPEENYYNGDYNPKYEINNGDILISWSATLGVYEWNEGKALLNQHIFKVVFDKIEIYKSYFKYAVGSVLEDMNKHLHGSTMKHITKKDFDSITIPLPPLTVQKKIADTLDTLVTLINKRKEQIELIDKLAKDAFVEMFGDPITNSKELETKTLGEIMKVVTGNTPPRANSEYYGDFIDWIKSDNINTTNIYITRSAERLSEEGYKKGRCVPENSILMTCIAGSHNCIGNIAITDKEVAFNQQINAIVVGELPVFFWYMQLLLSKQKVQELSTKGMKGIVNKTKLESLVVMVPPIDLQIKFSDQLKMIEDQKSIFKTSLEELEITYRSTMQKAFNREIFS